MLSLVVQCVLVASRACSSLYLISNLSAKFERGVDDQEVEMVEREPTESFNRTILVDSRRQPL